jgi:valyl-tRNA synthetase
LDPNKQKMSKSLGNVVDPSLVIHGGKCVWPLPLPYVIVAGNIG